MQNIYKPPIQHVHGRLLKDPRFANRHALQLWNSTPEQENENSLFLRYAFLLYGSAEPVFPGMILDDWGAEIKGIKMYRWVRENGDAFPRAEIFGQDIDGKQDQYFVRELDLTLKIRCYAYSDRSALLNAGCRVQNVLLPNDSAALPIKRRRPAGIKRPIRGTRINYWEYTPKDENFNFSLLDLDE